MSEQNTISVSIIMPSYNCELYLREAIDSVLAQTYKDFQLIIIDDCSTDNSLSIAKRYAAEDTRILLAKNPQNMGVSETRNRAIGLATGEWIAFIDSDDVWLPDKLEKQLDCARSRDNIFTFTGTQYIDATGKSSSYSLIPPEEINFNELLKQNVISCSSVLVKKSALEGLKMEGDEMHEDFALWLQVLKKTGRAYSVREPLLKHRLHSGSKSSNKRKAVRMNLNTYKYVGVKPLKAMTSCAIYIYRNLRKYKAINEGFEE